MSGEKVWLELNLYSEITDDGGDVRHWDGKVTWQWRGGRCVTNGSADTVEEAVESAWASYARWLKTHAEAPVE